MFHLRKIGPKLAKEGHLWFFDIYWKFGLVSHLAYLKSVSLAEAVDTEHKQVHV